MRNIAGPALHAECGESHEVGGEWDTTNLRIIRVADDRPVESTYRQGAGANGWISGMSAYEIAGYTRDDRSQKTFQCREVVVLETAQYGYVGGYLT